MNLFEKACVTLRHGWLRNAEGLWNALRPTYDRLVAFYAKEGLERVINGTDSIKVSPKYRGLSEVYEPEVWHYLMSKLRVGDTFVDVGAFLGIYAVAAAKHVGRQGRVLAFEPDPEMFGDLQRHLIINETDQTSTAVCAAVGAENGSTWFSSARASQNQILSAESPDARQVKMVRLDEFFEGLHVDILKIDVEGFEEEVLKGAEALLNHGEQRPRLIFIEVHPYNWHFCGTTSESLLSRLTSHGYEVQELSGKTVKHVRDYGEIVALRQKQVRSTVRPPHYRS